MNVMRFWSDLNMWNKCGLAAVAALVVIALLVWLLA